MEEFDRASGELQSRHRLTELADFDVKTLMGNHCHSCHLRPQAIHDRPVGGR